MDPVGPEDLAGPGAAPEAGDPSRAEEGRSRPSCPEEVPSRAAGRPWVGSARAAPGDQEVGQEVRVGLVGEALARPPRPPLAPPPPPGRTGSSPTG